MAYNPTGEVAIARDYAEKYEQTKVIVISVNENTGRFSVISYGENKQKCDEARKTADEIYNLIMEKEIKL